MDAAAAAAPLKWTAGDVAKVEAHDVNRVLLIQLLDEVSAAIRTVDAMDTAGEDHQMHFGLMRTLIGVQGRVLQRLGRQDMADAVLVPLSQARAGGVAPPPPDATAHGVWSTNSPAS